MLFGLLQCPHGRDQKPLRFARMTAELHKAKGRRRGGSRKSTLDNPAFLCHIQRLSNPLNDPHEQQVEGWRRMDIIFHEKNRKILHHSK